MSKLSSDSFTKSAAVQQRVVAGHPVHASDWERRLSEARAKRERALLAQSTRAEAPADLPQVTETARAKENGTGKVAGLWARVSAARPVTATLVFSGAAGLGFGVVLGLGVLTGLAQSPVLTNTFVPNNDKGQTAQDSMASVPATQTEIVAAALPPPETAPVSFVLTPGPAIFDDPGIVSVPLPGDAAAITLPALTPAHYGGSAAEPAAVVPMLYLPQSTAVDVAYGAQVEKPLQFFMHAPDGVTNEKVQEFVSTLATTGVDVAEIGRESFRVSTTHLRYYSSDTEAKAQAVAADLGIEARDFSQENSNSARIEIWMSGRPKSATGENRNNGGSGFFSRLRDSLRDNR